MPALVHDWVKAVMAILLKYQPVIGVGELGAVLLRLSQGLGRLRALLTDPARTRFVVVTRPAALPRAETVRLAARDWTRPRSALRSSSSTRSAPGPAPRVPVRDARAAAGD